MVLSRKLQQKQGRKASTNAWETELHISTCKTLLKLTSICQYGTTVNHQSLSRCQDVHCARRHPRWMYLQDQVDQEAALLSDIPQTSMISHCCSEHLRKQTPKLAAHAMNPQLR
mmetsp:Transcript_51699/g.80712  ORF Transcript_51699/g.80712 Transcript_51699/m.80712 type:complete len:114 (+) Transcript_51699:2-343(+)